ncbi:MAG TPA: hypothetical protein VGH19_20395 [Verrucomicrobiae bacterium]
MEASGREAGPEGNTLILNPSPVREKEDRGSDRLLQDLWVYRVLDRGS